MSTTTPAPVDVAEFVGLLIETALHAVLFVLTVATLYVLLIAPRYRNERHINWPMLSCSLIMFALSTLHLSINAQRCFTAFVNTDRGPPRTAYLSSVTLQLYTAKYTLFFMMLVLGDVIVIYRCFLLWQKNICVVLLPVLLSIASAILAFMAVWATRHYPAAQTAAFVIKNAHSWGTAIFTLSMVANIYATSGIAYRIWSYERLSMSLQREHSYTAYRRSLMPIARIIVESGALNAAYLIIYTAILDTHHLSLSIMNAIAAPFVGIVFSLVIVRVALDSEREKGISGTVLSTFVAQPIDRPISNTTHSTLHKIHHHEVGDLEALPGLHERENHSVLDKFALKRDSETMSE